MSVRATVPDGRPEPYLTRRQLAEIVGVSVDTIDRMRQRGMPSTTWGVRSVRFRFSEVEAWRREQDRGADQRRAAVGQM